MYDAATLRVASERMNIATRESFSISEIPNLDFSDNALPALNVPAIGRLGEVHAETKGRPEGRP